MKDINKAYHQLEGRDIFPLIDIHLKYLHEFRGYVAIGFVPH